MAATAQVTQNNITLRGSCDIVTEFFEYAINSILYQRGIYPPENFARVQKYGLVMLKNTEKSLNEYFKNVMSQIKVWLLNKEIQKLVIAICDIDTQETKERWQFDIETDNDITLTSGSKQKSEKDINAEISAIIRQITASVTFLPLLESPCTFDLLIYAHKDAETPMKWQESDPKYIANAQEVRLRSFTTKIHKVDSMVSYNCDGLA